MVPSVLLLIQPFPPKLTTPILKLPKCLAMLLVALDLVLHTLVVIKTPPPWLKCVPLIRVGPRLIVVVEINMEYIKYSANVISTAPVPPSPGPDTVNFLRRPVPDARPGYKATK